MRKTITFIAIGGIASVLVGFFIISSLWFNNVLTGISGRTVVGKDKAITARSELRRVPTVQEVYRKATINITSRSITRPYMMLEVTAYTWTGNRTASGVWPVEGRTIAINPKRFKLGQRIYLQGIGWRIAEDIIPPESVAKGAQIDAYMGRGPEAEREAIEWGRKDIRAVEGRE